MIDTELFLTILSSLLVYGYLKYMVFDYRDKQKNEGERYRFDQSLMVQREMLQNMASTKKAVTTANILAEEMLNRFHSIDRNEG